MWCPPPGALPSSAEGRCTDRCRWSGRLCRGILLASIVPSHGGGRHPRGGPPPQGNVLQDTEATNCWSPPCVSEAVRRVWVEGAVRFRNSLARLNPFGALEYLPLLCSADDGQGQSLLDSCAVSAIG